MSKLVSSDPQQKSVVTSDALPLAMIDIEKSYGEAKVLDGVNLALQPGSITGLLGRNASGKTTLIRTAVGLLQPEVGESLLFGRSAWNSSAEVRQRVGYVSQRFSDLNFLKVSTAIELIGSFYDRWDGALVERFRHEWNVPLSSKIGKLSFGQQQKVGILLGIGHRPELLILDEPVASLDPVARHDFLRALLMLNDEINQTILFSSHITTDIERVAADVAILHEGKINYHGGLDNLKEQVQCLFVRSNSTDKQETFFREFGELDGFISSRIDGQRLQVWVRDWNVDKSEELSKSIGIPIHIESVGLEELFMGMTS